MKVNVQNEYYCIRKTNMRVDKSLKTIYTHFLNQNLDRYALRLYQLYNYTIQYELT